MTPLSLYALTNDFAARVLRLPLSPDVQYEIQGAFLQQEQEFRQSTVDQVDFDGKYKPDDGECLVIKEFDDIDNLTHYITNPLSAPIIDSNAYTFSTIKALFSGYIDDSGKAVVMLQAFDRRKIISTAGVSLFYSGQIFKKVDGVGLTLDTKLSAILSDNSLSFYSFHIVRQMFDLTQYYAEATDSDLEAFTALPLLHVLDKSQFMALSDNWIRRKVSLIAQSQILQKVPIEDIKSAASMFNINLNTTLISDVEHIVIPQQKAEIKQLLRFLDEDYYQSIMLRHNYLSNSRRPA